MKKLTTFFLTATLALFFLLSSSVLWADEPPNPGGGPGGGDLPVGGGSPIGSGLVILLTLGACYTGRKVYKFGK